MKTLLRSAFVLVAALLPTGLSAAEGQSMKAQCYERSNLLYNLATEYGERLEKTRRVGTTGLLESFKSEAGTWTIVYSNDEGLSCVLAMGAGLESEEDKADKEAGDIGV